MVCNGFSYCKERDTEVSGQPLKYVKYVFMMRRCVLHEVKLIFKFVAFFLFLFCCLVVAVLMFFFIM